MMNPMEVMKNFSELHSKHHQTTNLGDTLNTRSGTDPYYNVIDRSSWKDRLRIDPNWDEMDETMGWLWTLHKYGFASFFLILTIAAFLAVLSLGSLLSARPHLSSLNVFLLILGAARTIGLFTDAYGSKDILPQMLRMMIDDLGFPCLLAALAVLQLAFIQMTQLKVGPSIVSNESSVWILITTHFVLLIGADIVWPLQNYLRGLWLVTQTIFTLWGLFLCCTFLNGCLRLMHSLSRLPVVMLTSQPSHPLNNQLDAAAAAVAAGVAPPTSPNPAFVNQFGQTHTQITQIYNRTPSPKKELVKKRSHDVDAEKGQGNGGSGGSGGTGGRTTGSSGVQLGNLSWPHPSASDIPSSDQFSAQKHLKPNGSSGQGSMMPMVGSSLDQSSTPAERKPRIKITDENEQTVSYASETPSQHVDSSAYEPGSRKSSSESRGGRFKKRSSSSNSLNSIKEHGHHHHHHHHGSGHSSIRRKYGHQACLTNTGSGRRRSSRDRSPQGAAAVGAPPSPEVPSVVHDSCVEEQVVNFTDGITAFRIIGGNQNIRNELEELSKEATKRIKASKTKRGMVEQLLRKVAATAILGILLCALTAFQVYGPTGGLMSSETESISSVAWYWLQFSCRCLELLMAFVMATVTNQSFHHHHCQDKTNYRHREAIFQ